MTFVKQKRDKERERDGENERERNECEKIVIFVLSSSSTKTAKTVYYFILLLQPKLNSFEQCLRVLFAHAHSLSMRNGNRIELFERK